MMAAASPFASTAGKRIALAGALAAAITLGFAVRPLTAPLDATVEMADMTWVEIRSAIRQGYETVIVPSGGIEQNGPHMVTGKHQHIVAMAARLIAEAHGRTLVAPVVAYVPEGDYEPPTGNMRFPGTIGVPAPVFAATLEGIARSLKNAGFRKVLFIADHGESQAPQAAVAEKLAREWANSGVRVVALGDYYAKGDAAQQAHLKARGETPATIGDHAGLQDTAELMAAHPAGVKLDRFDRLLPSVEPDGSSGAPRRATPELGRQLIEFKVRAALEQLGAAGL